MSYSLRSLDYTVLRDHLTRVHHQTHRAAFTVVSQATTWRNWLIGAWIFDYQQIVLRDIIEQMDSLTTDLATHRDMS